MKDKILYLILGILIGAVITAGCFLVFSKNVKHDMRGERPDFENMEMMEDGEFERKGSMREDGKRYRNSDQQSNDKQTENGSNQADSEV